MSYDERFFFSSSSDEEGECQLDLDGFRESEDEWEMEIENEFSQCCLSLSKVEWGSKEYLYLRKRL